MAKRMGFDPADKVLFILLAVSLAGFALALTGYFTDYLAYEESYEYFGKTYVAEQGSFVLFGYEGGLMEVSIEDDVKYSMMVIYGILTIVASAVVFVGILQNIFMPSSRNKFKIFRTIIYIFTIVYAVGGFVVAIVASNTWEYHSWHLAIGAWLMLTGGLINGICGFISLPYILQKIT